MKKKILLKQFFIILFLTGTMESIIAGKSEKEGYSRITIQVNETAANIDQIVKQLYKIIDVVKVKIFPEEGVIRREMMLLKVKANHETRAQIVQIAEIYRAKVLDVSPGSLTMELTGDVKKLRGFIDILESYGVLEIAKTGVLAMSRGEKM